MARSPYLDQSRLLTFFNTPLVIRVFRFPIIRWVLDIIVFVISRRYKAKVLPTPTESRLESTLNMVVRDVVKDLGYVGAMVATREADDSLPVRAYYVDPDVMTQEEIENWERRISKIVFKKVGLKAPIARSYLKNKRFKNNLSVRAIMSEGGPRIITHHELFSLFTPVVPSILRGLIRGLQKNKLGVSQVAAVPFFLEGKSRDSNSVVGNLFVLARNEISGDSKKRLEAFGRMAAIAIENERRLQQENRLNGQVQALQSTIFKIQTCLKNEQAIQDILDDIVIGVVKNLGYVGAMVAIREDDTLPVKAYFVDPNVITEQDIKKWERSLSQIVGTDIGLKAPIARTYLHDDRFKNNLSFRAVMAEGGPIEVPDKDLCSLFVPVVPESLRPVIRRIQEILDINQVIAVPFFLEEEKGSSTQVIGNLFVVSREVSFSQKEIKILKTFAQQAAIGIHNAQLYHDVQSLRHNLEIAYGEEKKWREEIQALQHDIAIAYQKERYRREAAEKIAQIADKFSNIRHNLRGELVKLQILADEALEENAQTPLPDLVQENLKEITDIVEVTLDLVKSLKEEDITLDLAKSLENPSHLVNFEEKDIREYIIEARAKSPRLSERPNIEVVLDLFDEELLVRSIGDLTEVFTILLNNAVDAMGENGKIVISDYLDGEKWVVISVSDTGPGVPQEYRKKIFEDKFSTKGAGGFGYGLFYARTALTWMNGEIWLAEENGSKSGATFLVKLPIANSN
ncbi:MAG: Adaptive-response sensory-kinase SasA [Anaerolineae bacterium]|nr:Adaptive-response sensory-kinase SasA [Anaerolineae bacterium]